MSKYVDGFVLPIPKKNLKAYVKLAKLCAKVWREHGAIDYVECVADDVQVGKTTSFPQSVKLKKNEVAIFSYITYKSRKHRDQVNRKVMVDPRMANMMSEASKVFDTKRMIYGGFKTIIHLRKK